MQSFYFKKPANMQTHGNAKPAVKKTIPTTVAKKTAAKPPKTAPPEFILTDEYKQSICSQSYLGKKGYTIPKSILLKEDDDILRKELLVKPLIVGVSYGAVEDSEFPVFRESTQKIYIPRFYGINRYGLPAKSEIAAGMDIQVDFVKELRDYQDNIVDIYSKHVNQPICATPDFGKGNGGILEVPCGRGKCLAKNTKILMYNGSIKLVQDIEVGDQLMGDDSTPRNVLSLARGREMMYRVSCRDYESYVVNESHILSLTGHGRNSRIYDISLMDYLDSNVKLYGYRVPITFQPKHLTNSPYEFGIWLGHNCSQQDPYVQQIPWTYKCNDRHSQLQLLAGIIDAIGIYEQNRYVIVDEREKCMNDIVFIARSLGFAASKCECENDEYEVTIYGHGLEQIPVKHPLKKAMKHPFITDVLKYKIQIERLEEDDYYGFEIDGNRRFVLGDFTVTHNTVMGLKIISLLKKKTIILVHKEFLMSQWIERIGEFLPTSKVGRIQGPVVDVKDKDIVIGMIQSIYDKDYGDVFSQFGLTIVDEVHRIGSEQFSKTLLKVVTPYMLGISATVERKDKLTNVLYMFIGNKIYSETRTETDPVCVRAIEYCSNDTEFNTTEYDFRGNPQFSTMIVKLCNFGPRSDFIIRVLQDLIEEHPDNQIMVIGHNRSLLTYLHDAIVHRKIASVGYYVGGMKQAALQETETKQIVVASFAMAAEGLDIKSLSTLVMVTPKTDIIQTAGRILRTKHANPIIVDIVDKHELFQKQWMQRLRYYKKCNYRVRKTDSINYSTMSLDWNNDTTWKKVFEPKQTEIMKASYDNDVYEDEIVSHANCKPVFGKCMIDIDIGDM